MKTNATSQELFLNPAEPGVEQVELEPSAAPRRRARDSAGFTLVEILVVLAIIGLIIGGVAVVASGAFSGAQADTAKNDVLALQNAAEMYMVQKKGKCPKSQQDLKAANVIKKVKQDPWGKPYEIRCPGEHDSIDVVSAGPDGEFGTADDINSWAADGEEADPKAKK